MYDIYWLKLKSYIQYVRYLSKKKKNFQNVYICCCQRINSRFCRIIDSLHELMIHPANSSATFRNQIQFDLRLLFIRIAIIISFLFFFLKYKNSA